MPEIPKIEFKVDRRKVNPFDVVAERVYWWAFGLTWILIFFGSVLTAFARKVISPDIVLIPKEIFDFTESTLRYFVLPVSIKIGGDIFAKVFLAARGIPIDAKLSTDKEETK